MKTVYLSVLLAFFIVDMSHVTSFYQSPYELILKDTSGGPENPQILVIKEAKSLKDFYRNVNKTRRPGLAVPGVNFDKEFIVILCMGTVETTGNEVVIKKMEDSKGELTIFVEERHPMKPEEMPKVLNEPFSIYRIRGNFEKLQFKKVNP